MFTGLIQHIGVVREVLPTEAGSSLVIDADHWWRGSMGDSIAVNGCCLTVASDRAGETGRLRFDVVHQTLSLTGLGSLKPDDHVNLEACVTPSTLLGGHIVQGHVDGVGLARCLGPVVKGEIRLRIDPPPELMDYIVPRGSIAIDGVSLTLASVDDESFEVVLIPTTLELTNLKRIGSEPVSVNLEVDCMVRAVVHYLSRRSGHSRSS